MSTPLPAMPELPAAALARSASPPFGVKPKSRMAKIAIGIAAVSLAMTLMIAVPAQAGIRRIGHCHAQGALATCTVSGHANQPRALYVKVKASPAQKVTVHWGDLCSLGSENAGKTGHFTAATPLRRRVTMGYKHPEACGSTARVRLATGGDLTVILEART